MTHIAVAIEAVCCKSHFRMTHIAVSIEGICCLSYFKKLDFDAHRSQDTRSRLHIAAIAMCVKMRVLQGGTNYKISVLSTLAFVLSLRFALKPSVAYRNSGGLDFDPYRVDLEGVCCMSHFRMTQMAGRIVGVYCISHFGCPENLILTHIAIAAIYKKLLLFLTTMCVNPRLL